MYKVLPAAMWRLEWGKVEAERHNKMLRTGPNKRWRQTDKLVLDAKKRFYSGGIAQVAGLMGTRNDEECVVSIKHYANLLF